MAVPSSGTLSMQDIAQERLNNTYGSGSVTGPISMYNLINGGNTGGAVNSGNTYPALNTGCDPHPPDGYITLASISSCNGGRLALYNSSNVEITVYVKEGMTESEVGNGFVVFYSNTNGTYLSDGNYQLGDGVGSSPACGCGYDFNTVNGKPQARPYDNAIC